MKKQIVFIINPISGTKGKKHIEALIPKRLDTEQYDWRIIHTEYAGHAAEIAAAEAANHTHVVVAVGGDGTVNEVARSLVHTQTALGIIPCGSGNGLARHLQIPMTPAAALQVINQGNRILADHGIINSHPFFCTCGAGFDAYVSDEFARSGSRGLWTYAKKVLSIGTHYRGEAYDIEIDGTPQHLDAFLIACGNASQYGNNVFIAPEADIQDGLLDLVIMRPFNKSVGPVVIFQMMNHTLTTRKNVDCYKCHHVVIERTKPAVIHCDGDAYQEDKRLEISIIPQSIYMISGTKPLYNHNAIVNAWNEMMTKMGLRK